MSFVDPVNLLDPEVKEDFNIKLLKINPVLQVKQENVIEKLAYMTNFEEISHWVEVHSGGKNFIADFKTASDADRLDCLFDVQAPLILALKNVEKRRKNGRDKQLLEAVEIDDYAAISYILASAATTYWRDHGYFNNEKDLKTTSYLQNDEKNQEKKQFQKAQLEHIGAIVDFCKANKKGAFQECLDFKETEEIYNNVDFED